MRTPAIDLRRPLEQATMVVQVNVTREFKGRLWLGKALLRLAARVLGCKIEIK